MADDAADIDLWRKHIPARIEAEARLWVKGQDLPQTPRYVGTLLTRAKAVMDADAATIARLRTERNALRAALTLIHNHQSMETTGCCGACAGFASTALAAAGDDTEGEG